MKLPFSKIKKNLADYFNQVYYGKKTITVTRWGKSLVAIVPIDEYEEMKKKLEPCKAVLHHSST